MGREWGSGLSGSRGIQSARADGKVAGMEGASSVFLAARECAQGGRGGKIRERMGSFPLVFWGPWLGRPQCPCDGPQRIAGCGLGRLVLSAALFPGSTDPGLACT